MANITPKLAVIVDNQPDTSIDDYLRGALEIISGNCITHASRVSGGRVCIFVNNEDTLNTLVQDGFINVKGSSVPIRKYFSAATKVVFSNVFPFITHEMLAEKIKPYGTITGHLRDLSSGSKIADCGHIKSFRKLAYVLFKDLSKVPDALHFEVDGVKVIVFITMDDVTCLTCNERGHISRNCKKTTERPPPKNCEPPPPIDTFRPLKSTLNPAPIKSFANATAAASSSLTTHIELRPNNYLSPTQSLSPLIMPPPLTNVPSTSSEEVTVLKVTTLSSQERLQQHSESESEGSKRNNTESDSILPAACPKKPRLEDEQLSECGSTLSTDTALDEDLINAMDYSPGDQDLTPAALKDFLKKSRHFKRIMPIVNECASNVDKFYKQLELARQSTLDRNLQQRLTRILKAMRSEAGDILKE